MKRFKAVVIGGSGYGGAELIRRLLIHPEVELVRVAAVDHVGEPLGAVHPPLTGRTRAALREPAAGRGGARAADVALLGLPHKVSAQHAPGDPEDGRRSVVDMSGDFRLRDAAAYARYYGGAHPHPELLGTFVYGLPELNRDAIRGGARGGVAGLLRDHDRARRCCRWRAPGKLARRRARRRASPARRAAASRRRRGRTTRCAPST